MAEGPVSPFTAPPVLALAVFAAVGGLYADDIVLAAFGLLPLTAVALARLWAGLAVWGVEGHVTVEPKGAFPGDAVTCRLQVHNEKPWPAFLAVEAALRRVEPPRPLPSPEAANPVGEGGQGSAPEAAAAPAPSPPGEGAVKERVTVAPMARRSWQVPVRPTRRGVYRWVGAGVTGADPWGWFRVRRRLRGDDRLWVYPRLHAVGDALPFRRDSTDGDARFRGLWANRLYPSGVREEGAGSLRDIDWKATARFQKMQFKQYDGGIERGVWVFFHWPAGARDEEAFETALSLAASLLWERLQGGDVVGFATNAPAAGGEPAAAHYRARTAADFRRTLQHMASLYPGKGKAWDPVLGRAGAVPPGVTPVIISPGRVDAGLAAYAAARGGWLLVPAEAGAAVGWNGPGRTYRLRDGRFLFEGLPGAPAGRGAEAPAYAVFAESGDSAPEGGRQG